ncbi:MAG: hypothetical protein M3Y21_09170 [Candidatus Eremiobacteraeota bacterium]|nr:hypothetical protein [Candidatus Eremiobacteraeota bacterium]
MQSIKELQRRPSPGGRPQPLAFDGKSLWMGSWDTDRLYEIEPKSGKVLNETDAPGKPYGIAVLGNELRVVVSIGEEDDRYFFRFVPGTGFDLASKTACPELTGSHLATDGALLYLGQMGNRRILVLDDTYKIQREIPLPTRIGGMSLHDGILYVIAADEEWENLQFATLDILAPEPVIKPIASIPFDARALAFDGTAWWTSHREASEIVSFTV